MARRIALAFGLAVAVSLARAASGCSSSSNPADNADASEDATGTDGGIAAAGDSGAPDGCMAGCLCFDAASCPYGCYPSQTLEADGQASQTVCSNDIIDCVPGGGAWSFGIPLNNCPTGEATYLDGGPDGSFCCSTEPDAAAPAGDADAADVTGG
jgi:hypothetical protein